MLPSFHMEKKETRLGSHLVGHDHPVYVIAEGGLTNWGDVDLAKRQVDAAMAAGADAIKFQAQTTEALVSKKSGSLLVPTSEVQRALPR